MDGLPSGVSPAEAGAAISKLISAGIGDLVMVFSRSPIHKHLFLSDIEWAIAPPVMNGQVYVAEAASRHGGVRAPIAAATWAFVSDEVDRRLEGDLAQGTRLRPQEWKSGDIGWIIDLVGDPRGVVHVVEWLRAAPFKDRAAKIVVRNASGAARIVTLDQLTLAPGAKGVAAPAKTISGQDE